MALGTITQISLNPTLPASPVATDGGSFKVAVVSVVGDSSYPTGGTALSGLQLGFPMGQVLYAIVQQNPAATGVVYATYNTSTGKLQAYATTGEVANTTNLSTATFYITAFGY